MRMDKLTTRFQQALADAQSLAVGRDNNIHRAGAPAGGAARASRAARRAAADAGRRQRAALRTRSAQVARPPAEGRGQEGNVNVSNDLNRLLNLTDKLAQQRGDQFIASELFVLAALEDKGELGAAAARTPASRASALETAIEAVRGGEKVRRSRTPKASARR